MLITSKETRKNFWCILPWLFIVAAIFTYCSFVIFSYRYMNDQPVAKIGSFMGKAYLTGVISNGDFDRLNNEIENALIKPTVLVVNSVGGSVYEGIRLGLIVKKHSLNVEVFEKCLSSCANYIVPAASLVILNEKSLMGWHGSPGSDDSNYAITQIVSRFENGAIHQTSNFYTRANAPMSVLQRFDFTEEINLNDEFYKFVNVSYLLPICGQKQGANQRSEVDGFYFYEFQDLEKFGIAKIVLHGDYPKWLTFQNENGFSRARFC
jgi:hypothetical protein